MISNYPHIPVLCREVVQTFDLGRPAVVVDGTLGMGGHAAALLDAYPHLTLLGLDWDTEALAMAVQRLARFGNRFRHFQVSYAEIDQLLLKEGIPAVDGILLDLGVSSLQLDKGDRGFSFRQSGPLDMRMSTTLPQTAWDILTTTDDETLGRIFRDYGEERFAFRIARGLKAAQDKGQLRNDTLAIADLIARGVPGKPQGIHPATRCFQALRIAVNGELDHLQTLLNHLPTLLAPSGRAVIIAYHSLEDRLVKIVFRRAVSPCVCPPRAPMCLCGEKPWGHLITKKALKPTEEEIQKNPRARSARMRVLEKLA